MRAGTSGATPDTSAAIERPNRLSQVTRRERSERRVQRAGVGPRAHQEKTYMRLFQLPGSVLVESETRWFRLAGETWDGVVNRD